MPRKSFRRRISASSSREKEGSRGRRLTNPTSTLSFGGSACNQTGTNCRNIATDPKLQADVAKEQVNMNSDLSILKVIPVLSLGFSYKF